jgi:hypothetical protein
MKRVVQSAFLAAGLLFSTIRAVASPDIDLMSDIEVSEYAARMSRVLENIQYYQLCEQQDARCVRTEMARYGISYDDKETVQKRLTIMIGTIH